MHFYGASGRGATGGEEGPFEGEVADGCEVLGVFEGWFLSWAVLGEFFKVGYEDDGVFEAGRETHGVRFLVTSIEPEMRNGTILETDVASLARYREDGGRPDLA